MAQPKSSASRTYVTTAEIAVVRQDGGPLRQVDKEKVAEFIADRVTGTHTISLSDISLTVQFTKGEYR